MRKGWSQWMLLFALWMWFVGVARADPENFMLHDLTFDRPTAWQWVETKDDHPRVRLQVTWSTNETGYAEFYVFSPSDSRGKLPSIISFWTKIFEQPENQLHLKQEKVLIQEREVFFFEMHGTYSYFSRGLKRQRRLPDYSLVGALIVTDKGNIAAILRGSKRLTDFSRTEFRKILEKGLGKE